MKNLITRLGSPRLPTAVVLASFVWAGVRLTETIIETAMDVTSRRRGWVIPADPDLLEAVDYSNGVLVQLLSTAYAIEDLVRPSGARNPAVGARIAPLASNGDAAAWAGSGRGKPEGRI